MRVALLICHFQLNNDDDGDDDDDDYDDDYNDDDGDTSARSKKN